jgi:hypothetical protein
MIVPRIFALTLAAAAGCALGDAGPSGGTSDDVWTPGNDDTAGTADDDGADTPADDPAADDAPAGCEFGCNTPPGDCFDPTGSCDASTCVYAPALAGEACADDCAAGGFCDASGNCICAGGDDTGDTGGNPDECMMTCSSGDHSTASCDAQGQCIVTCESPWEDCDGDPANGCEVPVGMPHQCDAGGLNPTGGCWTAYCGQATGAGITDFGTYHCVDCPTCEEIGGNCQWCNHTTGNFYPAEACSCGAQYLGAVCG